jgi:hypothetical protein
VSQRASPLWFHYRGRKVFQYPWICASSLGNGKVWRERISELRLASSPYALLASLGAPTRTLASTGQSLLYCRIVPGVNTHGNGSGPGC